MSERGDEAERWIATGNRNANWSAVEGPPLEKGEILVRAERSREAERVVVGFTREEAAALEIESPGPNTEDQDAWTRWFRNWHNGRAKIRAALSNAAEAEDGD